MRNTTVRLARIFWDEEHKDGAVVLEGARSPATVTDGNGYFVFLDLDPADYALIVGDIAGEHVRVSNPDESARIFTANQGEVTDVGQIFVDLR
jgi:hypothetical protein